jgi:hypothetical protein
MQVARPGGDLLGAEAVGTLEGCGLVTPFGLILPFLLG